MSDEQEIKAPYLQTPAGTLSGLNRRHLEVCEICIKHLKRQLFSSC